MKDAQKPDHISLSNLLGHLQEGRFLIPDFQREFEWKPWDIRDLMRSIFLDYYIGSLLLWRGTQENFDALSCEPVYGFHGKSHPEYIVLDGQQRLTALFYAFTAPDKPLPNRSNRFIYYVRVDRFMDLNYDEAFHYDWNRWGVQMLDDQQQQFDKHIFPLSVVGQGNWALPNWVQAYEHHWQQKAKELAANGSSDAAREAAKHAENASSFSQDLEDLTQRYQVSYIELSQQLEIDKVCDIFTQINSRGVQLDTFDLLNAMLKPKGLQLKQMWREAAPQLEFVETERMNVYILQVMSILKQSYCSPKYLYYLLPGSQKPIRHPDGSRHKEVLIKDLDDFKQRWDAAVEALRQAVALLQHPMEFGAISSKYLPYVSILPVFAALQREVEALPPSQQLDAQRKVRHWYWASVFLNRYSGSVESTMARDYVDVRAWLQPDGDEPQLIPEFRERFRQVDLHREVKSGTSVYNGIFNLLVLKGARDWMTGKVPQHGDLDDHHIVPASEARSLGVSGGIHTILNRTPLTAETNRKVICDRLPNEYLPELIEQNGEVQVRTILESHFISTTALEILLRVPFERADFEAFIAERNRTILEAIEDLLIKERLDLAPRLRELDQRIEQIELRLRHCIEGALGQDPGRLPSHVAEKSRQRIQAALKRSTGLDNERLHQLAGLLEFCDLRELQDVLQSKAEWLAFEPRFGSKELLATRFMQLAELRNGIRHSRSVNEIARKEGEAAVLWFERTLVAADSTADDAG